MHSSNGGYLEVRRTDWRTSMREFGANLAEYARRRAIERQGTEMLKQLIQYREIGFHALTLEGTVEKLGFHDITEINIRCWMRSHRLLNR